VQETNSINNPLETFLKEEWEKLNSFEKSVMKNYLRMLKNEIKPSNSIILEVNKIHERFPDFHIGCVP
jgi:hypothetical protein